MRKFVYSDFPEYYLETKTKFLKLSKGLSIKKMNNISYKNLKNFKIND